MWLVCACVLFQLQDPGVPLPTDVDRSVPLEAATGKSPAVAAVSNPAAKPLQERVIPRPRKLAERTAEGPNLGNFILWSAVVVALLVGFFVFFRKFTRNSRFFGPTRSIDVIGKRGLGPRQSIFLVEVGGKVLVVGSTRENLSTLGEISDPAQIDTVRRQSQGAPNGEAFRKSLDEGIREFEREPAPVKSSRYNGLMAELSDLKKTVRAWRA